MLAPGTIEPATPSPLLRASTKLMLAAALGFVAACCLVIALRPTAQPPLVVVQDSAPAACPSPVELAPTLVDVAPGITATQLAQLIVLAPGEQITSIDDAPVAGAFEAGVALSRIDLRSRRYLDIEVSRDGALRRVLVLLH